jgi:hypothetical protein
VAGADTGKEIIDGPPNRVVELTVPSCSGRDIPQGRVGTNSIGTPASPVACTLLMSVPAPAVADVSPLPIVVSSALVVVADSSASDFESTSISVSQWLEVELREDVSVGRVPADVKQLSNFFQQTSISR